MFGRPQGVSLDRGLAESPNCQARVLDPLEVIFGPKRYADPACLECPIVGSAARMAFGSTQSIITTACRIFPASHLPSASDLRSCWPQKLQRKFGRMHFSRTWRRDSATVGPPSAGLRWKGKPPGDRGRELPAVDEKWPAGASGTFFGPRNLTTVLTCGQCQECLADCPQRALDHPNRLSFWDSSAPRAGGEKSETIWGLRAPACCDKLGDPEFMDTPFEAVPSEDRQLALSLSGDRRVWEPSGLGKRTGGVAKGTWQPRETILVLRSARCNKLLL